MTINNSKLVSDYFTLLAPQFDSLYSDDAVSPIMRFLNKRFRSDIYERFRLTINYITENKFNSVFDFGCGSGRYLEALADKNIAYLVGLDISEAMIEMAYKRIGQKSNIKLVTSDFMTYDSNEKFECIYAMGVFDYISDPLSTLKKMNQMASKSILVSFPSISFYRTPIRKIRYYIKNCPLYFYTKSEIIELCTSLNLSNYDIIKIKGAGMDYWVSMTK